jgi:predicted transcriptional regulator
MKTAVSIPDKLYSQAEELADTMGLPRSQLFAKALEEFLKAHRREAVTEKLDQVYGQATAGTTSQPAGTGEAGLDELRKATRDDAW